VTGGDGDQPTDTSDGHVGEGDDFRSAAEFPDDPDRVECLRAVADDLRARGADRASLLAAVLYRVSDLYDPEQPADTTPEGVYRNMRTILQVTERGTLARDGAAGADSDAETNPDHD